MRDAETTLNIKTCHVAIHAGQPTRKTAEAVK
jgi:hypothetical protein